MNLITRATAKEEGLTYYYTGEKCPKGHIAKRSVHNCTCYECKCQSRSKADNSNKKGVKKRNSKYYENNKLHVKIRTKKWQHDNKIQYNYLLRKYTEKKKVATPSWADLKAITEFYKKCPKNMVVDHIIPLQGTNVTGFHLVENLQYLTKSDNSKKCNTFEPLFTSSL